jgi:hypothetical protein
MSPLPFKAINKNLARTRLIFGSSNRIAERT